MADLPFSNVEFYRQFSKGRSMLYLAFVRRMEPMPQEKPSISSGDRAGYLVMREIVGVYEGTADARVILGVGNERIMIPAEAVRGLKEFKAGELLEILEALGNAVSAINTAKPQKDIESPQLWIKLIDALRRANNKHPILVPRYGIE